MQVYTIFLADDHALFREGIRKLIDDVQGLCVAGEAGDGIEMLRLLKRTTPDMVILDISMPGLLGLEAAREIRAARPDIHILILSMHRNRQYLAEALEAGVQGYLLKEDSGEELLKAIACIRGGGTYLSPRLASSLSSDLIGVMRPTTRKGGEVLSRRERQVLKLIAEGHTDREISELLFISLRTVQRHRFNIRTKLNLKHTADLVKYALSKGYTVV
jgi:DNA-binding NarL/FixJ family response regulator